MFNRAVWASAVSHRRKSWAFAALFLLSTTLSSFMMAQPAYADTGSDIHDINYKHYAAIYLRDCLSRLPDDRKNTILQARANDPNVFLSSSWKVGIGLYLEPTDGVAGCEEGTLIQTALLSLGYADNPGKLLTDIGYTVDRTTLGCSVQNAACENGTQNRYTRPAGGDTFNSVFASRLGDVPDYARYVAYMSIFNSYCQLVEPPTGDGSAITYKKVIKNSDGNYSVEDAKAEFIIENRGGGAKFDTGKTQIKRFEYNDKDTTCRDLLTGVGSLTSDVARYNNLNKNDPITEDTTRDDEEVDCTADPTAEGCTDVVTCSIEGIGWLVCPAMIFMADITDKAYSFLASNFLSIDASTVSKTSDAWAKFRDIANILFVVALLAVVYSQITSIGITNYGIKKMLPRIAVAAVLVNLSFIICQAAVDLSNILGYGVSNLFVTIDIGGTNDEAQGWSAVIGAVLVGSAAVGIALALSVPVLLSALLAVGLIVLILVGRQALIVLLVAIAPLAFVAYLLPNTEQWFKKWAKLFSTLLLLFPIIGIVFGASRLAANIIGRVAESAGEDATMYKLIALGITAIPFFVVPGLLKGALNAAGSFGTKLSGMVDKAGGSLKKNVGENSQLGAYKKAWDRNQQIKRAQIQGGVYQGRGPLGRFASGMNRRLNSSAITGQLGTRTAQQAAQIVNKLEAENVEASRAQIEQANLTRAELRQVANGQSVKGINGQDSAMRAAAITEQFTRGDYAGAQASWNSVVDGGDDRSSRETKRVVANATARSSSKPGFIGQGALQGLREGSDVDMAGNSLHLERQAQVGSNRYSAEAISKTSNEELQYVSDSNGGTVPTAMRDRAQEALLSGEISKNIGNNRAWIDYYAGMGPRP